MLTTNNTGSVVARCKGEQMCENKQRIRLTRNTVVGGQMRLAGWSGLVSEKDARYLMQIGKAVPAKKQTKKVGKRGVKSK